MSPEEKANALDELKAAISIMESQKSLTTEELVSKYYVERESKFINKLKNMFLYSTGKPLKVLFCGHIGSGKSSELFKLKQDLDNEFLMIYYSIKEYMNLSGTNTSTLMETMAEKLKETAVKTKVKLEKDILESLKKWKNSERRVRYQDEKRTGAAGIGGNLGVINARGELHTEKGTKTEELWEQGPNINELILSINRLLDALWKSQKKEPVIIIDDIDKLDLADAEELFFKSSQTLTLPNCKIVYTVPIALLYSDHFRQIENFYHKVCLLPISKVRKKDGSPNEEGIDKIRKIIERRIPINLFGKGILEKIIMEGGGVVRDTIRIVYECCLTCITDKKPVIDESAANEAVSILKNEFRRQIPKDLYRKLIEVKNFKTKTPDVDRELQRLLYCQGVLEYSNDDTWYDVHPLAYNLAEEKEKEYKSKERKKKK
jgi:hypothetical protein